MDLLLPHANWSSPPPGSGYADWLIAVFERWYSNDLQVVVKSTRTDPRFGTTTYTLNNVQRTEPAATLFTVPSDYTVQQGGPGRGARGAMRMPPAPTDAPLQQ